MGRGFAELLLRAVAAGVEEALFDGSSRSKIRVITTLVSMAAIGSLVFCTDCGNLLDGNTGDPKNFIICDVCGASCQGIILQHLVCRLHRFSLRKLASDTSSNVVVTTSKPSAFPSALRAKRSEVQTVTEDLQRDAVIKETCPKCGREEVRYYTQQLRSADEGTTVFFHCECGHKYVDDNVRFRQSLNTTDGVKITEEFRANWNYCTMH